MSTAERHDRALWVSASTVCVGDLLARSIEVDDLVALEQCGDFLSDVVINIP